MEKQASKLKLVRNSIIYSISGMFLKCFSFFLLPLYTAYLTTEDYGITSICISFISTSSFIVTFSLFSAVMRFYVDYKKEQEVLKRFYGTIVSFVFISTLIFGIGVTVFRNVLVKYIFSGIDYYPIILIALISLVFYCQQAIYTNILQSQQRALKFSILNIVFFFVALVLNVTFVVVFEMGAIGSLIATMLGYIIYTIYFFFDVITHKEIKFCLDFRLLKGALKYSIPIMPHNLSTQLAVLISKVLIGGNVSMSGVGMYSIASQFGNIADTIQCYIDQAYGPWLYEKLHTKERNFRESIRSISKMLSAVLGFFFLGISLFAQDYILLFIDFSYADAWRYVPLIVLTFTIKTAYYFYVEILFYYKKASRKLFIATLTGSIINILLTYFLVPNLGIYGSILADAIAMVIRVGLIIIISKQYDDVGFYIMDFVKNFIMLAGIIGIGLIFSCLKFGNTWNAWIFLYKCFIVWVYGTIVLIQYKSQITIIFQIAKQKIIKSKKKIEI